MEFSVGAETIFLLLLRYFKVYSFGFGKTILCKYLKAGLKLSLLKYPLFCFPETMDQKIPYDDYQLPVVFLPSYENPPAWIPLHEVHYPLIHEPSKKPKTKHNY